MSDEDKISIGEGFLVADMPKGKAIRLSDSKALWTNDPDEGRFMVLSYPKEFVVNGKFAGRALANQPKDCMQWFLSPSEFEGFDELLYLKY